MSISYPESLKSYLKMDYGSNLAVSVQSVSKMVISLGISGSL